MKLPGYEQRVAQIGPQQSMESALAPSRAMNQFVQSATEVGGAIYEAEATDEYNRGMLERSKASENLKRQYDENEYMRADALGDLADETNTELRPIDVPDGLGGTKTEMVPMVPTSSVMSAHYAREMAKFDKAVDGSLKTSYAKNSYQEKAEILNYEDQAEVDGFAFERNQQIQLQRSNDRLQQGIDTGDADAVIETIELGVTNGLYPREKEAEITAAALEELSTKDFYSSLADEDMPVADRELLGEDIANDPYIPDEQKEKLLSDWSKVVYDDHRQLVADATIDRDVGRINGLLREYTEKDYQGALDATQRKTLIGELERTLRGMSAGAGGINKAASIDAKQNLRAAIKSLQEGGNVDFPTFLTELPEQAALAFPDGEPDTVSDRALFRELQLLSSTSPLLVELGQRSVLEADAATEHVSQQASGLEGKINADTLNKYNASLSERKRNDTLRTAERNGLLPPTVPMDYSADGFEVTLKENYEANRAAAEQYGVPGQALSPDVAVGLSRQYEATDTAGKLEMISGINSAVENNEDRMAIYNQLLDESGNNVHLAGMMAANGNELAALDALRGNEIRRTPDGQRQLENAGWGKAEQREAALDLTGRANELMPGQSAEAVESAMDYAAVSIAQGMDIDKALARSLDRITGGEVQGSGSDRRLRTPINGMKTAEFRKHQQAIDPLYYIDIGWDYDENPDRLITTGQVEFRSHPSGEQGKYTLWDNRSDQPLATADNKLIVVNWAERRTRSVSDDSALDIKRKELGIFSPRVNDPEFQAEQDRIRERKEENKRIREEAKERRRSERNNFLDMEWFGGMGGETGSFFP